MPGKEREQLTLEFFGVEVRDLAAGVVALVYDHAVFTELRVELFFELDDALDACVGDVHVPDASAGGFGNDTAIVFDTVEITHTGFVGDGLAHNFPGPPRTALA